ncbi:MAG: arginine--tRNA ligase [Conexivisphaerales archaeon]
MAYSQLRAEAERLVNSAIERLKLQYVRQIISRTPSEELGELSSNASFMLSKALGRAPYEIAVEITNNMDRSLFDLIKSAEAHQTGYINFRIDWEKFLARALEAIFSDKKYGIPKARKIKVIVEHTSVNPNKALHIGHVRNVVIGDTVARIMKALGHDVQILNYIDDTGVQVADLVLGFLHLGYSRQAPAGKKLDHYYGDDVYVNVNRAYEKEPSLQEKRKEITRQLEEGYGEGAKIAEEIVHDVVVEQLKTCWRVGAEYDLLNYESQILRQRYWEEVFERLKNAGAVKLARGGKFDGCWVMEGGEEEEEKVLVRSDGTTVYAAKDIPYAAWKLGLVRDRFAYDIFTEQPSGKRLWMTAFDKGRDDHPNFGSADIAITVIGVEQTRLQNFVKKALEYLGKGEREYIHLAYEKVALSKKTARQLGIEGQREFVQMKGRTGIYINADDVFDMLYKKAKEETRRRNSEKDEQWVKQVAEAIALSAIRYEMLKQDIKKIIVFDMDEALNLEGDTGPYLMYSYARAVSVLRKANYTNIQPIKQYDLSDLDQKEKELILCMSRMEEELQNIIDSLAPDSLCRYAHELATSFNAFYERCPIINSEYRERRLMITEAFRRLLAENLDLLGIKAMDAI